MGRLDMLSSRLQAVIHRRRQAGFVAAQTALDATGHFLKKEPPKRLGLCGVFLVGASGFLCRSGALCGGPVRRCLTAESPTFSGGRVVFGLTPTGAALLPAVSFLIYGGPSSALCLVLGYATLLVAFLDVFSSERADRPSVPKKARLRGPALR
jgi:hypothetical protein